MQVRQLSALELQEEHFGEHDWQLAFNPSS
jgi:hypothetical protein